MADTLEAARAALQTALAEYRSAHMLRWIHPSQEEAAKELGHAYARVARLEEREARRNCKECNGRGYKNTKPCVCWRK